MQKMSHTGLVIGLALSAATLPSIGACNKNDDGSTDATEGGAVTSRLQTGTSSGVVETPDIWNGTGHLRSIAQDATPRAKSNVPEAKQTVQITGDIVTSDGSRVKPNPSRYYGHGYIVGSPISSADEGVIWGTYELHINQGYFPDDSSYIGSDVHLSVDGKNKDIFRSFQTVEKQSHQQYVFEYIEKNPLNPEIEDSKLFLQRVYTLPDFLKQLNVESLPKGIRAKEPWHGSSGNKTKVGRIVDVERFGAMGDFCVLEINMSGLSSGGGEKLVKLTVMDQDIAVWCEKAMALGRDVEIQVSEDVIESWQPSSMIVTGIQFKDAAQKTGGVTQEQYESIRDKLLADPVFIESIRNQKASPSGS